MQIDRFALQQLRTEFPIGCRVRLICLIDDYRDMPVGTTGTVHLIDDSGTIHVSWDNYGSLGVLYGVDVCERMED